jgi:hypothetical protein
MAADAVWHVHVLVTGFIMVAWALPWPWALWASAIGAPAVHAQWRLNDECVLTTLERRLRGLASTPPREEPNFLTGLAHRLSGREPSQAAVNAAAYGILWGGAVVATLRLATG